MEASYAMCSDYHINHTTPKNNLVTFPRFLSSEFRVVNEIRARNRVTAESAKNSKRASRFAFSRTSSSGKSESRKAETEQTGKGGKEGRAASERGFLAVQRTEKYLRDLIALKAARGNATTRPLRGYDGIEVYSRARSSTSISSGIEFRRLAPNSTDLDPRRADILRLTCLAEGKTPWTRARRRRRQALPWKQAMGGGRYSSFTVWGRVRSVRGKGLTRGFSGRDL
jgi:hypothetical protein